MDICKVRDGSCWDDFDIKDCCTRHDMFKIQNMARVVCLALRKALEFMPEKKWSECCQLSVDAWRDINGDYIVKSAETIRKYHRTFRLNGECFKNPQVCWKINRPLLPPMLDWNPDLKDAVLKYCKENLPTLSGETVYNYLLETALPKLLNDRREELEDDNFSFENLLQENGLTKLTMATIYNWMRRLGFKYGPRTKVYYVDSHEKPETKAY